MLAAKCKFLSSFQSENIPSPDLLLCPQHIIPVEGSLAKKSSGNSQPCLQSGSGVGASSPASIPWSCCPAEMSLIPPSVPSRLWPALLSDSEYIQQAVRLLVLNIHFSHSFSRNYVFYVPQPTPWGASGAFRAKLPLSHTLHADRREVHTKTHLSSLPLTKPKQKTDGKSNAGSVKHVGCTRISPPGAAGCIPSCSGVPGQSQTPKRLLVGEMLLFPLASHQAAWRWDRGKEGKRQRQEQA